MRISRKSFARWARTFSGSIELKGKYMKVRRMQDVQEPAQKKHKSKKKKNKRLFRWIRFLLITALLSVTLVYGALSPFFNIKEVKVAKEAVHYDNQTLEAKSGILPGVNGFRLLFDRPGKFWFLRIGAAESSILESCPYVKSAKVRYVVPSTASIEVEEREAAAILTFEGTSLLADREEFLLEVDPDTKKLELPVIRIKKPKELKPGKKLDLQENEMPTALKIYEEIRKMDGRQESRLLPEVDYVDVSDLDNVGFLLQSRIMVRLGGMDDLVYKLNAVNTVFSNNIKKNEKGKLEFTSDGNPVFTPGSGR
jgi:cell division septal protein FtsQ